MSLPDRNHLMQLFNRVDKDRSGAINAVELQSALSNGTWTPFNPETIRMMIGMFDRDNSSTISFDEFVSLWKYIDDWQKCFRSFDKDKSGSIDRQELKLALTSFGYRLSDRFYELIVSSVNSRNREKEMSAIGRIKGSMTTDKILFDDFIYVCCKIQTLTQAFRQYDYQQQGVITIKYEDFLTMIFGLKL